MISTKQKRNIADLYLKLLGEGKVDEIVNLFHKNGKVLSPIYGEKSAFVFFQELNDDTRNSLLEFKGFFNEEGTGRFALFFKYKWEMANGNSSNFDVVDIFELDDQGKIVKEQIIYNASESAALLNKNP